jgi:hypothetical protein
MISLVIRRPMAVSAQARPLAEYFETDRNQMAEPKSVRVTQPMIMDAGASFQ